MSEGKPNVGWIGAGRMGAAIAARMLAAGYRVSVYNRTRSKAENLEALGALVVDRPIDLAMEDVVFSMVSASDDLEEVMLGRHGLLVDPNNVPPTVADASTVSIASSARVREAAAARGSAFFATPVSGNPAVVQAGGLTVAVSGPRDAFDVGRPLHSVRSLCESSVSS